MEICVCGWYYEPKFLSTLISINPYFPVTIVANQNPRAELPAKFRPFFLYRIRENKGCEYGAYDWYIKNAWAGGDVLFMHDDIEILPIFKNYQIAPETLFFKTVSDLPEDLAYIFKSDLDHKECYGVHGRGIFIKARFIQLLLDKHDGIPWDRDNDGYLIGPNPGYCHHFNWADYQLRDIWKQYEGKDDWQVGVPLIIRAFAHKNRGGRLE